MIVRHTKKVEFFSLHYFFDLHWWLKNTLVFFIIFLPFQNILSYFFEDESLVSKAISYLDELFTFVLFLVLCLFILLKPSRFKFCFGYPFTKYLLILFFWGFLSLIVNEINFFQGSFGIYDIFKNLIVLYVISSFNWSKTELERVVKIVIFLGFFLSVAGIISEIIALIYGIGINEFVADQKRFGLYRTLSIVGPGNGNYLALYCLLSFFLLITINTNKFLKLFLSLVILTNIFFTFSRQAWIGLVIGSIFLFERKVYRYTLGILLFIIVVSSLILVTITSGERYEPEVYYRAFTVMEALKICIDNPFLGSGPGTFGGVSSVIFESSLYDQWPLYFRQMVEKMGSIDSFWPSVSAELGIFGLSFLILFFVSLFRYNLLIKDNFFMLKMNKIGIFGKAICGFTLILIIMNTFTGFNKAFVVYTFFTLNGIYLSYYRKLSSYEKK